MPGAAASGGGGVGVGVGVVRAVLEIARHALAIHTENAARARALALGSCTTTKIESSHLADLSKQTATAFTRSLDQLKVVVAGGSPPRPVSTPPPPPPLTESEAAELNEKFNSIFAVSDFEKFIDDNERNRRKIEIMQEENEKRNRASPEPPATRETSASPTVREGTTPAPAVSKPKIKRKLSERSRQSSVPSSRLGRMFAFGSLAVGLGVNSAAEYAADKLGVATGRKSDGGESGFAPLSPANAEKIVATLCKVRGAALKLGQLLSLQDESVMSPELAKIFDRVRHSADFMPPSQVEKMMKAELGADWRTRFGSFDDKPFAAASIGQVHLATLPDGAEVAVKIQYPGVARGIHSDIDNLVSVLNVWNVFPEGLFIENIVEVAKRELAWEVDYEREAACTRRFRELLAPYPEYYVPRVHSELSGKRVLVTELIEGVPLDECFGADLETREKIARMVMNLVLREMFVFRCMQTDPNWSNFFYDASTGRLALLDFGATRTYPKEFIDKYIEIIKAASEKDAGRVLSMSREMKFLTGYESEAMERAHVDTVMIMAEIFTPKDGREFDFAGQDTTRRLQKLVPTILTHRLCPPPEEIYSLHRKLSGVFLLCAKLGVRVDCGDMFRKVYEDYHR